MSIPILQNDTSPSQNDDGMIETSRILSEIGRTHLIITKC